MSTILVIIAVCLSLTICGFVALQIARTVGAYDRSSEPAPGRELSNAEVTAILKRGKSE